MRINVINQRKKKKTLEKYRCKVALDPSQLIGISGRDAIASR
jgi:hypothetical protein